MREMLVAGRPARVTLINILLCKKRDKVSKF